MQEIKDAVWECGGDKAPAPDGFTFKFIKSHWDILGHDIFRYMKEFETSSLIPRGCNSSFITLIPKVEDPLVIHDYRPISLIGCQYKTIAKVLANRLALVISLVVGESQTAFIKGRQIIDGPLMVDEIISCAKMYKKKLFMLNVDFEKAFDSFSWSLLDSTMMQMGFSLKWRQWMRACLNSGYTSVLIGNGEPTSFWLDKWLGGPPLCHIFPRLFRLEVNKDCRVCDRCPSVIPLNIVIGSSHENHTTACFVPPHLGSIVDSIQRPNTQILPPGLHFNWAWNRPLRSTAETLELEELANLISQLSFSSSQDKWEFTLCTSRRFTVQSLRYLINNSSTATDETTTRWNKVVPIKVNISSWRVVYSRLPTRVNLDVRGIDLYSVRCPLCDDDVETEVHLFISCKIAKETWSNVLKWRKLNNLQFSSIIDIITLADQACLSSALHPIFDAFVQSTIWILWRYRNEFTFGSNKNLILNDLLARCYINCRSKKNSDACEIRVSREKDSGPSLWKRLRSDKSDHASSNCKNVSESNDSEIKTVHDANPTHSSPSTPKDISVRKCGPDHRNSNSITNDVTVSLKKRQRNIASESENLVSASEEANESSPKLIFYRISSRRKDSSVPIGDQLTTGTDDTQKKNEFGDEGTFKQELLKFHVLQGLESRGSIVRQSTISRKKEVCSKGEYTSGLDTNMIYLYHYAKQLGQLQRLEITKANKTFFDNENMEVALGNGVFEERIADFVHAIRAICDRLEKPKAM
ncbi:RNA-directed DNA polymerase, eukaryota, reverse transcriptase zinc-binding domain protein [Tanacetum coccineum]